MKPLIFLCLISTLVACQATPVLPSSRALNPANPLLTRQNVVPQGVTKAHFSYSADKTELTVIIESDTGEVTENSLIQKPLGGSTVTVETVVKRNNQVVSRHRTLASEAELAIKVAANNGWRDVFTDLKARYKLAGLVQ